MPTSLPTTVPKDEPGADSTDRFDYALNLARAGSYGSYRGDFWPPVADRALSLLDLAPEAPASTGLARALAVLGEAVEAEWARSKDAAPTCQDTRVTRFADPVAVASAMRGVAAELDSPADRRCAQLRAAMVENGYDPGVLAELAALPDDVAVIAAQLSTWYGKEIAGRPTAFAARRDEPRQRAVREALQGVDEARDYLARLHADLRVGALPRFAATRLFFMAGEGNRHPKHIAYFLPEDEGVPGCAERCTYYFANTHRALLSAVSAPLAARFLDLGTGFDPADPRFATIPTLGVLSHELGHFVHRPGTSFAPLHDADRWASAVLQETAADVFGALVLADVWAHRLGLAPADVITYYLAECLRYTSRGLGLFPDSDGMFLQLTYYLRVGALRADGDRLVGEPGVVLAGLRSFARVLADVLLGGRAEPALAFYRAYGPECPEPTAGLVAGLRRYPLVSVDYAQDHIQAAAAAGQGREASRA